MVSPLAEYENLPQPTADRIKTRREATGESLQECKRYFEMERVFAAIRLYLRHGDRIVLCDILTEMVQK